MKLSEMRQAVAARGIQLTKSLGQNFLHDANQLRRIVDMGELTKADRVLEIGPGLGPLTALLVEKSGEVLAIEKDARLVAILCERFPTERYPKLRLFHGDALEFLRSEPRDWSGWKLVANLPYSVASPILVELAQPAERPERMVVTLQVEVARRLIAGPGDKDYGLLSLLVQLDYEARDSFKIPASCFFPKPGVASACVTLVRRANPLLADEQHETFTKIVRRAFSQRRKMMFKLLREDWRAEKLDRAFRELDILPQERAEKLSLEKFVKLSERLAVL